MKILKIALLIVLAAVLASGLIHYARANVAQKELSQLAEVLHAVNKTPKHIEGYVNQHESSSRLGAAPSCSIETDDGPKLIPVYLDATPSYKPEVNTSSEFDVDAMESGNPRLALTFTPYVREILEIIDHIETQNSILNAQLSRHHLSFTTSTDSNAEDNYQIPQAKRLPIMLNKWGSWIDQNGREMDAGKARSFFANNREYARVAVATNRLCHNAKGQYFGNILDELWEKANAEPCNPDEYFAYE